jgi:hypothetical protein
MVKTKYNTDPERKEVSTPKDPQIHAQIDKSGGSGDGGDIFGVSRKDALMVSRLWQ